MLGTLITWLVVIAVSIGAWCGLLAYMAVRRRAGFVEAGPPTQQLGPEPPALVHLITRGWKLGDDAVEATLLDLAAKKVLEIERKGPAAEQAVIRIKEYWREDLTDYENFVLQRVMQVAVADEVPLPALQYGTRFETQLWFKEFSKAVVTDARRQGLSKPRISPTLQAILASAALVPAAIAGMAGVWLVSQTPVPDSVPSALGLLASLPVIFILFKAINVVQGESDTERGREVAARWLGVRDYLAAHPGFENLPPAAVSLWGRYFAYGAAFGLAHTALHVLELGPGDDRSAWSAYGGIWRQVRIRYPWWPGIGTRPLRAIGVGVGLLGWAALAWWVGTMGAADLHPNMPTIGRILAAASAVVGLVPLVGGVVDLVAPRHVGGQILHFREKEHRPLGSPRYLSTTRYWIAVDSGESDCATGYRIPSWLRYEALEDDIVELKVGRCFGLVRDIRILQEGWHWRLAQE